ncbi:MAG: benzoate-CoA ligase family protein [Thermoanaerobaculia bacterium]
MELPPPERFNLADWLLDRNLREGRGGRIALRLPDRDLTYAGIAEVVNRFGNVLAGLGVRPEERVLIALPDGVEFVGALLGAIKIGAVAVMVNPDLPAEGIAALFDYSRARLAVVDFSRVAALNQALVRAEHRPKLLTVGPQAPGCPSFEELGASTSDHLAPADTHRDDPALWLFSGGTTGRPKAVVQPHRSYANTTVLYGQRLLGLGADDVTLAVPKLFFGYATGANLFFPFSVGASAVLFPGKATPESIFAAIERHRPTLLVNVPTMIGQMVQHPGAAERDLSSLRLATSAGEALPVPLHERWRELFGVELLDGLGTAEMWHVFLSNRPGEARLGTLGRVVPGFEIRVADEEGCELPDGEVGELWVRGDSRAWGYWQEMDKTKRTFRGEWVVTGDLVARDAEGYFTYHGRGDDVAKVGGKWFSPAEVESCLARHPEVAECAVLLIENLEGLPKPHAWVVATSSRADLARELQELVARELAPYKAPREVQFVDSLPRTHLGKIDRGRLRRS